MNLLNHNIRIKDIVYHIQTEVINRNLVNIVSSLIYQDGEIIWSNKNVLALLPENDLEIKAKEFHKDAINHLKNIFKDKNEYKVNILKLQKVIKEFKEKHGKGVFSIELFRNDNGSLITGYNTNQFAGHIYSDIYKNINKNVKVLDPNEELRYYFIQLDKGRSIVIGDIECDKYNYISYGILVNFENITFAMFLNLILPKFIETIEKNL